MGQRLLLLNSLEAALALQIPYTYRSRLLNSLRYHLRSSARSSHVATEVANARFRSLRSIKRVGMKLPEDVG